MGTATGVAFYFLRRLELWLHQHIFKVGWLVTKNFQTTTILYYTFFLPGIFVYEATIWLVAGALDVRAERAIKWPEPQETAELRLNFVQLARRASPWKVQLINLSPLATGMIIIWWIGIRILHLPDVAATIESGGTGGVIDGLQELMRITDFWLWAYFLFTIGNTIIPEPGVIKNWRWLAGVVIVVVAPFFLLGVQEQFVGGAVTGPIANVFEVMLIVSGVIIVLNMLGVALLSIVENAIEYITGDSATFKNGKMIVMTREEAIAERKKQREAARRRQKRAEATASLPYNGLPSIYKLEFPIPGGPGKEPVTAIKTSLVEPKTSPAITDGVKPRFGEPSVITSDGRREQDTQIRFGGASARTMSRQADADEDPDSSSISAPTTRDRFNESVREISTENKPSVLGGLKPRPSPFSSVSDDDENDYDPDDE